MNCIEDELCRMPSALPSVNGHKNYELCFYTGQNKWLPSSSPTASVVMYSLCTTYYCKNHGYERPTTMLC
ncbi:hypothetical protein BDL97_11G056000 [Sphagnum fallax]|nr:hypothetical protein BDL97_11G056000 [Sphagnum fallax]